MQFSIATALAFAAAVLAQTSGFDPITKPTQGEKVPAGSTYEIVWEPSPSYPGTITIGLLGGASPQTLAVVDTIAKGVDGAAGSYSWKVSDDLGTLATYGIIITLESSPSTFQYGFPFKITSESAGAGSSSKATSSGSTKTATSAVSSETSSAVTSKHSSTVTTKTTAAGSSSTDISTVRNSTTTSSASKPKTTVTSVVVTSQPSSTTSSTPSLATNGVASLAAAPLALLGGVAMAVLAL